MANSEEQAVQALENVEHAGSSEEPEAHTDVISSSTISMVTVRLSDSEPSESLVDPELQHNDADATYQTRLSVDDIDFAQHPKSAMDIGEVHTPQHNEMDISRRTSALSGSSEEHGVGVATDTVPSNDRSRRGSSSTISSDSSTRVDWEELEKTEEQESKDEGSDESTAFLLARLEQENNALVTNPKSGLSKSSRMRNHSRPPSIHYLKKLVDEPPKQSLRYSLLPSPPPMTELEFWAALVADYPQTAQRLPTLTSNKIRGGIPPPLRGIVWISIAGARDRLLEEEYDRLCGESSPYENLIGKDIGRSFPGVEMFRDPDGEGQQMLGRVLKCFSLYDNKIGYCQGLGFVVGPLLMHMADKEAFCVLVRLMEHYDLRSCFLPDLSGLHLRIYQFQRLLAQNMPTLAAHLEALQIEPLYVSQWFLSFFAVTCPLPMLLRIYDVILTEGASETLMRVALSLMRRNEKKILDCHEFEDIMQLLLSRALWDTYNCNADDLVSDFVGLTGVVTHASLQSLEVSFKEAQKDGATGKIGSLPDLQAAASRFLGRFWAGSNSSTKSVTLSPGLSAPSRPVSFLRRTPSKQSMASTLCSVEGGSDGSTSTAPTEATPLSRQASADCTPAISSAGSSSFTTVSGRKAMSSKDKDLHGQIEDLLTALSDLQREQAALAGELQKEREEREEDRQAVRILVGTIKRSTSLSGLSENRPQGEIPSDERDEFVHKRDAAQVDEVGLSKMLETVENRLSLADTRRSSILQTKHQLRDDVVRWKEQYEVEVSRIRGLNQRLGEQDQENSHLKEQLKDARSRLQDSHRDKQRLEKTIQDLRSRKPQGLENSHDSISSSGKGAGDVRASVSGGLRELKLGRTGSIPPQSTPTYSKRTSSLATHAVLATEDLRPAAEEALLLQLVNAKTAEAIARQELEEVKGRLDSLRKMLGVSTATSPGVGGHRPSPSEPIIEKNIAMQAFGSLRSASPRASPELPKPTQSTATGGGFFSGWKRSVSNTASNLASPEAR